MNGIGIAIAKDAEGKPYMYLNVQAEGVNIAIFLADADNAQHTVDELIRGLKAVRADLKREASGLVMPSMEVIPDGLRNPQRRK